MKYLILGSVLERFKTKWILNLYLLQPEKLMKKIFYHITYGKAGVSKIFVIREDKSFYYTRNRKINKKATNEALFRSWDAAFQALLEREMGFLKRARASEKRLSKNVQNIISLGVNHDSNRI